MNLTLVDKIADAVLYEGYMLYPYRASAVKNRQRWNFGAVYPETFSAASSNALVRVNVPAAAMVVAGSADGEPFPFPLRPLPRARFWVLFFRIRRAADEPTVKCALLFINPL